MPKAMIERLIREACEHLSNPSSSKTLRKLCRKFLKENTI
jgi:hypothetical protein